MQYDRFQLEAIEHINNGYSVLVSAPTGAGKTAIAEYVIQNCIDKNEGVIYTSPIKAVSNQKYRDFQKQYPDRVGILTGDVSINPNASVLIMTTEIFRNKILDEPETLKNYSWVIFDEIHYIDNEERGTVWEESIIFMPAYKNILCLSATIPNIKEFASWVEFVHKTPIKVVMEDKRPVPLKIMFQCENKIINPVELKEIYKKHIWNRPKNYQKPFHAVPNRLVGLMHYLQNQNELPCIYFVFGRQRAEDLAFELYTQNFINEYERERITELYKNLCQRFNLENEQSAKRMFHLVERGIAYHHAGMLPTLKEVVEQLFTSRLIKVIFTTETFALGVNMPARSVVISEFKKTYGNYISNLKTRDFYQMAGRAGRRGIDDMGFVYVPVNPFRINSNDVDRIIFGRQEQVRSQINFSYATLLNLYKRYKNKLLDIYPFSLHYFQSSKNHRIKALSMFGAKIKLLEDLGYINDNSLTNKGLFASSIYGYELMLSELYERSELEKLDAVSLGVLCVSLVFEPRRNQRIIKPQRDFKKIEYVCKDVFKRIKNKEISYRIYPISKEPYFNLANITKLWLNGSDFSVIRNMTDTDEGEIIRYFRMAVQLLREITTSNYVSFSLSQNAVKVIRMLNRGIVDAEKQLRS